MSWEDVENAMQRAVCLASGYSSNRVFWSYQNVNEPSLDHMLITFGGEMGIGQDRIANSQDLSRPAGQEMKQEVRGVREVPFIIECFTTTVFGNVAARRILELTRTNLQLKDIRYMLRRVKLTPFDVTGVVNWIPDIPSVGFRGRARVEIRCYVPVTDCASYVGYIANVNGRATVHGSSILDPLSVTFDSDEGVPSTSYYTTYYGAAATPGAYDSTFITSLTSRKITSRPASYTFNAAALQYSYVCMPTSLGGVPADFTDHETGFSAAMTKVATSVDVGGDPYDVWISDVAGLGVWTVDVA